MADYPTTQWSRIVSARQDKEQKQELLGDLIQTYWQPVYIFARHKGLDPDAAKDAVQGLFLRLLERDFMEKITPSKGKLRSYLRSAMSHYLADQYQRQSAQKRGGQFRIDSLDTNWADRSLADSAGLSPEEAFERSWAQVIMERAFARLAQEYRSGARKGPVEAIEESFRGDLEQSQSEVAARYEMSVSQLKSFLFRARLRFKELVAEEVGETVGVDEVAEETQLVTRALTEGA